MWGKWIKKGYCTHIELVYTQNMYFLSHWKLHKPHKRTLNPLSNAPLHHWILP